MQEKIECRRFILLSKTELKFNLASVPFLVPNIGIEVKLSEKIGYQLDTSASFYNDIEGSPFHMTQIFNEIRYVFFWPWLPNFFTVFP